MKNGISRRKYPPPIMLFGLALLIGAVVVLIYWPVLDAKAVGFDDYEYLVENQLVQQPGWKTAARFLTEVFEPSSVRGYYQPLTMISLMLDYAIAGQVDNLRPFHRTSLILHVINTLLLMCLLYMLFGRLWIAAGVALLFGLHPVTVESVAWVAQRKTLLAAFFAFGCWIAYVRYTRRCDWKFYIACMALYVLALMSKPTSVPIPLTLLLLDFWPLNRLNKRAVLEKIPLLMIGLFFAIITIISQSHTAGVITEGERSFLYAPLILCHNIVFYLCKFVWPVNLTPLYPFPRPIALSNPTMIAGVIGSGILIAFLIVSVRRTRALLTGWLIFIVMLLPASGVVGFTMTLTADRHFYMPAIGYLLMIAWLLIWLSAVVQGVGRRTWRIVTATVCIVAVAVLLSIGTRQYLQVWQTIKRHKFYMLKLAPDSPYAHFGCGNYFKESGQYGQAISYFNKAIALKPDYVEAYTNRSNAYTVLENYDLAVADCNKAIELLPENMISYNNRGNVYNCLMQYDHAIQDYTKAIALNPNYAPAYNNRGLAYMNIKDYARAILDCSKAIELRKNYAKAYYNRANAYMGLQDCSRAIADYNIAIALEPDSTVIYYDRANTYLKQGDADQALADYNKVIAMDPDYADAYYSRGNLYVQRQEYKRALSDFDKAIALNPEDADAYDSRGKIHQELGEHMQAVQDYTQAIAIKPDNAEMYYNRGNAYVALRDLTHAIEDYGRAIQLQPDYANAYYNRGHTLAARNDYIRAIADYNKVIALRPDDIMAYHNRAVGYYWLADYAKAWVDVDKCQELGGEVNARFIEALMQASPRAESK